MDRLSERFDTAMVWAARRHAGQRRHNTGTPYVSHLLATCAIVLEEGGDERLAIGALLHDVLEDQPTARAELRETFGAEVCQVVEDCTDADLDERATVSWIDRKRAHVRRMADIPDGSLLVIAADKVSSLQSLVDDLVRYGAGIFERSARSADELLGNYREVLGVVAPRLGGRPVVRRLASLVEQLAAGTGLSAADSSRR
jgi:(p)ppGpp synthase/HD superfamily hydrolase